MTTKAIRCFQGSAAPEQPYWVARMSGDTPEVAFDGPISEYLYTDESTRVRMADLFKQDLYAVGKGGPVTVRINSPGGEIFAASAIRAVMVDYPGEITTRVDSVCASCATYLLTAGQRTVMLDTASVMIHDPYIPILFGLIDIDTGQMIVDALKSFKDSAINAYESRTGLGRDRLAKMMNKTTYMSANDALQLGFADEILTGGKQAAPRLESTFLNSLTNYGDVPAYVLNLAVPETDPDPEAEAREREAQRLREFIQVYRS